MTHVRRALSILVGIGILGFALFVKATKSCKSTCTPTTNYGIAIACAAIAVVAAALLFLLAKPRNGGA